MRVITTASSADEQHRKARLAVPPVGSFEQHGDFLPLAPDTLTASLIAQRITTDYNLFLLPPITVSCSHEHEDFAGTVSITATTLIATISDIRNSLSSRGIHRLVVVARGRRCRREHGVHC